MNLATVTRWVRDAWREHVAPEPAVQAAPMTPLPDDAPEWTPEQTKLRAGAARALIADPLLGEAFASLERTYVAAWMMTEAPQVTERERLWSAVAITRQVQLHLRTVATEGAVFESQIRALARSTTALRERN